MKTLPAQTVLARTADLTEMTASDLRPLPKAWHRPDSRRMDGFHAIWQTWTFATHLGACSLRERMRCSAPRRADLPHQVGRIQRFVAWSCPPGRLSPLRLLFDAHEAASPLAGASTTRTKVGTAHYRAQRGTSRLALRLPTRSRKLNAARSPFKYKANQIDTRFLLRFFNSLCMIFH